LLALGTEIPFNKCFLERKLPVDLSGEKQRRFDYVRVDPLEDARDG
jgi:hypothetical protein